MDGAWLHRARWRWRGAWMWPTFVATIVADGLIARYRPFAGSLADPGDGILIGAVANLLAVVLLAGAVGALLRHVRPDLPRDVARNYGGTLAVLTISAGLLAIGLARHAGVVARQHELRDAVVRAEAYIGAHAPAEFAVNAQHPDTFTILPGALYRTCVPSRVRARYWCVIVKERLPLARSVAYAGGEPNAVFGEGVQ